MPADGLVVRPVRRVSLVLALLLTATVPGTAAGAPVYPSEQDVAAARAAVADTAADVGAIEAQLAAADARLEELQVAAGAAAEDYNDAVVALEEAGKAADAARQAADRARGDVENARRDIGALAAATYRTGAAMSGLDAFLSAGGPQELLDTAAGLRLVGEERQHAYQRMDAAELVAKLLDEQAQEARARQERAAAKAEAARVAAERAAQAAADEVAVVQDARAALVARLAELRETSVEVEAQRQAGLEEERRRREEAAARAEAERRAAEQAAEREAARRATARQAAADQASRSRAAAPDRSAIEAPAPRRRAAPQPEPRRESGPSVTSSRSSTTAAAAGEKAVAWALTQVGKDYEWGGSGPNTFDCSGLTSQAWQKGGGKWITRTSRSQWSAVAKVPYSQMRPGDLIFYGTNPDDPSTIWHVAIYAGGGMMVEAPRTGLQVRKVPVRYVNSMPSAGRP